MFLLAAASIIGCDSGSTDDVAKTLGYVALDKAWTTRRISVCWEESALPFRQERAWVQEHVVPEFRRAEVNLVGWGFCASGTRNGIRIDVRDDGANPHVKGLGRTLRWVHGGMVLNFTFNNWSTSCRTNRESCIKSIAAHEFGHAVGMAHEHNRPDTPASCTEDRQGSNGDRTVGAWDLDSIMNYCNPVYNNAGRLSTTDIASIELLFRDLLDVPMGGDPDPGTACTGVPPRSVGGGASANVYFANGTPEDLNIEWVNFEGQRTPFVALSKSRSTSFTSYVNHYFEARRASDNVCIGRYRIAGNGALVAAIEEPMLPVEPCVNRRPSGTAGMPVSVTFHNETNVTQNVFWIDSTGTAQAYGSIPPFGSIRQQTYTTHVWMFAPTGGRCYGITGIKQGARALVLK